MSMSKKGNTSRKIIFRLIIDLVRVFDRNNDYTCATHHYMTHLFCKKNI